MVRLVAVLAAFVGTTFCFGDERIPPSDGKSSDSKPAFRSRDEGSAASEDSTADSDDAPLPDAVRSKQKLIEEYRKITRAFARRGRPKLTEVTLPMVALYHELKLAQSISHKERAQMRKRLKILMEETQRRLYGKLKESGVKDPVKAVSAARAKLAQQSPGESPGTASSPEAQRPRGAVTIQVAMELISLIEDTIAPDSWEVRGGRGSIRFFSPLNVLVIRATGEVHHQIGGTLEQLRRIQ